MKHLFPGNNTSQGFVNYFDGIIPPWEENKRIYVLKGGPGVGKNTCMHKFAQKAEEDGYDIEYFHCASDCDSLDAVRIPKLGMLMLDGTAPHVIDPVLPGAVDNIVNLGVYLNEKGLAKKRGDLEQYSAENSACYKKAFSYLKAAGSLAENTDFLYSSALDTSILRGMVKNAIGDVKTSKGNYAERKLFASAISPQGYTNYLDTAYNDEKVLRLKGPSAAATEFIRFVMQLCNYEGFKCEVFYSPLLPDKPEHLFIRDLGLCITVDTDKIPEKGKTLDLNDAISKKRLDKDAIKFNEQETAKFIDAAIHCLSQAKAVHDKIEAVYKKNMDFDQSTVFLDKFLQDLF